MRLPFTILIATLEETPNNNSLCLLSFCLLHSTVVCILQSLSSLLYSSVRVYLFVRASVLESKQERSR